MRNLLLLSVLFLSGCSFIPQQDKALERYVQCSVADRVTTAIGLSSGKMVEGNVILKALHIKALGTVGGTLVPAIALSVIVYHVLKSLDKPEVTVGVGLIACSAAIWNTGLILQP